MFERFTEKAIKVIMLAQEEARRLGHNFVGTEQILLGLIGEGTGIAAKTLKQMGVNLKDARIEVEKIIGRGSGFVAVEIPFTPRAKKILEFAWEEARELGHNYIGTEHLLLGLIHESEGIASKVLENLGVSFDKIRENIIKMLDETGTMADSAISDSPASVVGGSSTKSSSTAGRDSKTPTLNEFSVDLTKRAEEDKLDPVIGRQDEIERTIQILGRRTKNNPVLIGEPGVGKTAVAEGLAQRIIDGNAPESLLDKKIIQLDMGLLIAGTKYRGEFEERLKKIMDEIIQSGKIVLVIDEIHNLVGAGAAEGAIDAANILKPVLARGELRCIGATTLDEYRKHIEKDSALERRFQQVLIEEPSQEETVQILAGLAPKYEAHHGLKISQEAIEAATALSIRYINDRFLPDKAIDLLDEAGSLLRFRSESIPDTPEIIELDKQIDEIQEEKEAAVDEQDFEKAADLRDKETKLKEELTELKASQREARKAELEELTITAEDIARVVSRWTGVPVGELTATETKRLQDIEGILHERVIGQDQAVKAVSQAIRRARVGLKNPERPIGTFIFAGPTGVGKTELGKSLSEFFFGSEDALIRVDMSEFMERHTTSRLVGSPPGYVGYGEGGELTEKVRKKPYSVILFDEIEKAHPDVFNILLQILDDGRLTDSKGRKVNFKNTIIIMTSNVGASAISADDKKIGFSSADSDSSEEKYKLMQSRVMEDMRKTFKPEFLNRIDEVIIFHKLNQDHLLEIFRLLVKGLEKRLSSKQISINLTEEAEIFLCKQSQIADRPGVGLKIGEDNKYTSKDGARPLLRVIQRELENTLAEKLVQEEVQEGDTVNISITELDENNKQKLVFDVDSTNRIIPEPEEESENTEAEPSAI